MGLYDHFQTAITFTNLFPFFKIRVYNFETMIKNLLKKDLMRIILLRAYTSLKL